MEELKLSRDLEYITSNLRNIKCALKSVLETHPDVLVLGQISVGLFIEVAKDAGWKDMEDYEANGWQGDFWLTMQDECGTNYNISGTMFYGNLSVEKIK